jgi:hypothetical protein
MEECRGGESKKTKKVGKLAWSSSTWKNVYTVKKLSEKDISSCQSQITKAKTRQGKAELETVVTIYKAFSVLGRTQWHLHVQS